MKRHGTKLYKMEQLIEQFKLQAIAIEAKYLNRNYPTGKGLTALQLLERFTTAAHLLPKVDKELTDLANRLMAEHKVLLTQELETQFKTEGMNIIRKIFKSNTVGLQ